MTTIPPWRWIVFGMTLGMIVGALLSELFGPPANPIAVPVLLGLSGLAIVASGFLRRFQGVTTVESQPDPT